MSFILLPIFLILKGLLLEFNFKLNLYPTLGNSYSSISAEGNIVLIHGEEEVNLLSCCPVL